MATARDRYETKSYYESRDKGRAEHLAQDLDPEAWVCDHCGGDETGCAALQSGHSVAYVTRAQFAAGLTSLDT